MIIWWNMACHRSGISLVHTFLLDVTPDIMAGYDGPVRKQGNKMSTDQDVPLASHWCRVKTQPTPIRWQGQLHLSSEREDSSKEKRKKIKKFSVWKLQNMGWKNKKSVCYTEYLFQISIFFFESLISLFDALQVPQHW